MIVVTSLYCKW